MSHVAEYKMFFDLDYTIDKLVAEANNGNSRAVLNLIEIYSLKKDNANKSIWLDKAYNLDYSPDITLILAKIFYDDTKSDHFEKAFNLFNKCFSAEDVNNKDKQQAGYYLFRMYYNSNLESTKVFCNVNNLNCTLIRKYMNLYLELYENI